jgi:putative membrane-bound dehydrogenase-like protein
MLNRAVRLLAGVAGLFYLAGLVPAHAADDRGPPLSPAQEQKSFRLVDDDLVIELVAAEPDVISPVAISWDEDGRMYVTEMSDFPNGPFFGRIKILEGFEGAGKVKKSFVFADKLHYPTGTLPWKGGVFATVAPNIWYFKNTKGGDGQADERRVVLTGFQEGPRDCRVNGLQWGLDNWIYGANGRHGAGKIRRPEDPADKGLSIRTRDFRFRPDTIRLETIAGPSQFGLTRDDWGNRFLSWNTNPIRHEVLEQRYLSRNPWLADGRSVIGILTDDKVYRISPRPETFDEESVTSFNASCGITIYRGGLLGENYEGNAFICEALTNLVQRRVLKPARAPSIDQIVPDGLTFVAERGANERGKEFLASTDPWFHPVNMATGPDGALYVVDFYRQRILDPVYVPKELAGKIDWRKGADHGRIWRIRRKNADCPPVPHRSGGDSELLVQDLEHSNGWRRDTAQRLLVERQDPKVVPFLKKAFRHNKSSRARVHALWVLHSFQAVDEDLIVLGLADADPSLRVQALRMCEGRLADSPALRKAVLELATDRDARVRFRCALVLGDLSGRDALRALARLLARDGHNEWARLAILSGLGETAMPFLGHVLEMEPNWLSEPSKMQVKFLRDIAGVLGARSRDRELATCLVLLSQTPEDKPAMGKLALLAGLIQGLNHSPRSWKTLVGQPPVALEQPLRNLDGLLSWAEKQMLAEQASVDDRILAFEVLCWARPNTAAALTEKLLLPEEPVSVQQAAARGLEIIGDPALVARSLNGWGKYTVSTRQAVLHAVSRSPRLASPLLGFLERKDILTSEVDATIQANLRGIRDKEFQSSVAKVLKSPPSDRAAVVARYKAAFKQLENEGKRSDPEAGARLFLKNCTGCHQLQGQGHRVGPELVGLDARSNESLIEEILDPSKSVSTEFRNFVIVTKDGRSLSGLLVAETATSVTLRRSEGIEEKALRTEIEEFQTTGKSLMPDGLEQALQPQDLADLLAFLKRTDSVKLPIGRK